MVKAYNYRIYPTKCQKEQFEKNFGVNRVVYNLALQTKIEAYRANGTNLSSFDLCYQLAELKKEYPWMKGPDSQSLQASIKNMTKAFNNFFKGEGYPKFKSKRGNQSFLCPNNKREINWEKSTLTIPKIENIPIVLSRSFDGKIKTVAIRKTSTGKYFASILAETETILPHKPLVKPETTIGIDLGIKSFVISSDRKAFEANRKLKDNLSRLKCLSRRVSKKKKGGNNRKKAVKCLAILHEKITNQRTDYIHKITHALTHDNQVDSIVVENLNVAGMLKNRKLSQAISDVGFGEFVRQLKYKCDWYGKNFIQIGRFEPSSKTCSECQAINDALTLANREWICANCGTLHDRDLNAAKNIKQIGLNNSGEGISGGPVEKRRLRRSGKQEKII